MYFYRFHDDDVTIIDTDRTNISEQLADIIDDFEVCIRCTCNDDNDSMLESVVKYLKNTSPYSSHTNNIPEGEMLDMPVERKNIYENDGVILVAYYVPLTDYLGVQVLDQSMVDDNKKYINTIGSSLVQSYSVSDVILVKYDIKYVVNVETKGIEIGMEPTTLTETSLKHYLTSLFVHTGLIVNVDGTFEEYTYTHDIFDSIMAVDPDYASKYRYHEYGIFNHKLHVIVDTTANQSDNNFNLYASVLCGKRVYGNVHCSLTKQTEYGDSESYIDLTHDRLTNIHILKLNKYDFTISDDGAYVHFDTKLKVSSEYIDPPDSDNLELYTNDVINDEV